MSGSGSSRPVLTLLYVPGDRPERFAKAVAAGADVVIIDLEDAVAPAAKARARTNAAAWLATLETDVRAAVQVRVNHLSTPWGTEDLAVLRDFSDLDGIRVPKVESAADVDAVQSAGGRAHRLHPLIETARGIEAAYEIASHPGVVTIGLGEADLASDLAVQGDAGLAWPRSRVVVAARAAGLPPPAMSVFPWLDDEDGLAESCGIGRDLGLLGRAAIHPRQLPTIVRSFRPGANEVTRARDVVEALMGSGAVEQGVTVLPSGEMLDPAMLARAEGVLARETAAAQALARMLD